MLRQIRRNIMKRELGTNDIQEAWYQMQVAKYGPERYCAIRNSNRQIVKMGKGRIHKKGYKFTLTDKGITQELNA